MAKKPTITSITSGYASTNTLNDNFTALRDAFDNTLSLDGSTPNSMTSDLNLNNNDILNASRILVGGVDYIATALSYKNDAETAKTAAEAAQAAAELAYDNFDDRYLGSKASDPTVDNDGNALLDGALYYDTINTVMKFYDTSTSTWYRTTPTTSDQANIDIVAGNTTNINTVAGISANVTTVAGISSDVTTVAADTTDIGTVATSISNINTAATNISNINTVAGISANVTTVAGNTSNINTVATDISNVNTVAGQTTNLQNVTDNLTAIQNAATNATNAATSASNAATSASNASTSETNAASSATSAAASAAAAAASADFFDDVYLGSKASDPATDNDGDALNAGDLYFNTTSNNLKVYSGSAWQDAAVDSSGFVQTTGDTLTGNLNFGDNVKSVYGAGSDLQIYHDGSHSYIDDAGTGDLRIRANNLLLKNASGEDYITATSNGSVSIAYDNATKLATTSTGIDVTGTVTADGLTVDGAVVFDSSAASANIVRIDGAGNQNTRLVFRENGTDKWNIGSDAAADFFNIYDSVNSTNRLTVENNGDISFYEDTGTTAKFFWDASAESLGIGTSSPDAKIRIQNDNSTVPSLVIRDGGTPTTHMVDISSNATGTAMRIDSSGNVVIGGTDASYGKFSVRNGYAYINEDGINTKQIYIRSDLGGDPAIQVATNHALGFRTNNTERMRIDSSGRVGIGTSSSASGGGIKLNLNGSSGGGIQFTNNNNGGGAIIPLNAGGQSFYTFTGAVGSETYTERMRIDSNGHVGIGTTAPAYRLQVKDASTSSTSNYIGVVSGNAGNAGVVFGDSDADAVGGVLFNNSENALRFFKSGFTEAMRLDSSGNLLLGTTSLNTGTLGASNQFAELAGGSTGSGTLILSRASDTDASEIGGIRFANANNADDTNLDSNGKLIAGISARVQTSDSNASDDSGGHLVFYTKPEAGNYAERMRIDSSGRLLVGKTSNSNSTAGTTLYGNGKIEGVRNGGSVHQMNRLTSDGSILDFQKDGSTVGSIGSNTSGGQPLLDINASTAGSSQMRFTTSGSEAMRIDSSGNLLVGRTSSSGFTTSAGSAHFPNGSIFTTVDGGQALNVSRLTSDGDIAGFYKDGTKVGSIGSTLSGGRLTIDGTDGVNIQTFLVMDDAIYLGGTAAGNALDDYEEGTYTATLDFTSGSVGYSHNTLTYTKIGRVVWVQGRVLLNSVSSPSGGLGITLPFTVSTSGYARYSHLTTSWYNLNIPNNTVQANMTVESGTVARLLYSIDNGGWSIVDANGLTSSSQIQVSGFYIV